MTPRERKAWLASLKVGDEVAVIGGADMDSLIGIRTLTWITAHGLGWRNQDHEQISSVKENGIENGAYGRRRIEPVTVDHRAIIAHRDGVDRLNATRWQELPSHVIARVIAALDGAA